MAARLEAYAEWICWVRVWERAERRASFWGLGGIGGGATLGIAAGRGVSKGDVRRSSTGLGLWGCCCCKGWFREMGLG